MRQVIAVICISCLVVLFGCSRCNKFVKSNPFVATDTTTIYVLPFSDYERNCIEPVASEISRFYRARVIVLPTEDIYADAKSLTGRYAAPILLMLLNQKHPGLKGKILALTSKDIFCESNGIKEWGIFGLGSCPGKTCVISNYRLKRFTGKTLYFTINVTLHELGHNFGLVHCNKSDICLMNDAHGTIKTLYREKRWLCPNCQNLLASALKNYSND